MGAVLLFGIFLAPVVALAGLLLNWFEVSRLRRFIPGAFESGVTILKETVTERSVSHDPNSIARSHAGCVLFVRRTVSVAFAAFPAARIVRTSAGAELQVRLAYGFVLFYVAAFMFSAFATMLSQSPFAALFVAAILLSIMLIVSRERAWGRAAAPAALQLLNQRPNEPLQSTSSGTL